MKNIFMLCCGLLLSATTFADSGVNLILTKGSDKAIPIAVVPFAQSNATANMADIISADLNWTGAFKALDPNTLPAKPHQLSDVNASVWRSTGVEDVVIGSVSADSAGQDNVHFAVVDLVKAATPVALVEQNYHIAAGQERALAHHIADVIFEQLTGVKGIFSTRIAYVQKVGGNNYMLLVSDADGYNPRPILTSVEPIMSPAWSPDGKRLAYVSFEDKHAQIYVATIASGQRQKISEAPGINGAPAWSPDGRSLALVLSKSGAPKIYVLDLASGQLKQLTTGRSIDTEPNFAPDGQSILFTSDRGGSPQIYRASLAGGKIDRITFSGEYNARASFSRDGKQIVMLHRTNGQYNIAIQNLATGVVVVLTHSGRDDSPTFAPNGMMILYGNEYGELGLVSADGRVKLRVPGKGGTVQDPAWSPFLS